MPVSLTRMPLDPGRFWIRYVPRRWPVPGSRWLHLAAARLGPDELKPAAEPLEITQSVDDVVYLPATREDFRASRDRIAQELGQRGVPAIVQILLGEEAPSTGIAVLDLTDALLELDGSDPPPFPKASIAVWPLVRGITDGLELVDLWAPRLVDAGFETVTVVRVELTARQKRELAEGRSDAVFEALFHEASPSERPLAGALASHGLRPFPPRPTTEGLATFQLRRRLAGWLAEAAELDLRSERHGRGQQLYRAARHLDDSSIDMAALHREGNLRVIRWLDPASRELLESALAGEEDPLEEHRAAYLG